MADVTPTPSSAPATVHGSPSPSVHPGIKGFMKTDTAGMPNWVWLLVIGGGIALAIGVKYYAGKKSAAAASATPATSGIGLAVDPTTGLPYAVSGLVPSGAYAGGTVPPPPPPVPNGPPVPGPNGPGSIFAGPTGVEHYVATGNQTLTQIAAALGFQSWNSIYAIPDNQKLFGAMDAKHASAFVPSTGEVITIPSLPLDPNTALQTNNLSPQWPGGTTQTRVGP